MTRGRGGAGVSTHLGKPTGLAGEGSAKGLLPGADQDYVCRGPEECGPGGGVIPLDGTKVGDGESVT